MANRRFYQFYQSMHYKPVQLDCSFVVDPTDLSGNGVTSFDGSAVQGVYMHSSASITGDTHSSTLVNGISSTASLVVGQKVSGSGISAGTTIAAIPSSTSITLSQAASATASGVTLMIVAANNPNPAAGYVYVKLQDNYNALYAMDYMISSPLSGSGITIATASSLTVGSVYTITVVGSTTTAQWQAVGVPVGITPAVGVSFVATATSGSGTGQVQASSFSGVTQLEVVGDPDVTLTSSAATVIGTGSGAYLVLKAVGPTDSTHTTPILKAPATGTKLYLKMLFSNSSLNIGG